MLYACWVNFFDWYNLEVDFLYEARSDKITLNFKAAC